jgi:protein-S-isoprenylcysteine O-methyltransferase Ste14
MTPLLIAISICALWTCVWLQFGLTVAKKSNRAPLPNEQPLVRCGILLLTAISLFYTALYGIPTQLFTIDTPMQLIILTSMTGAASIIGWSRAIMSDLNVREVLFAVNPEPLHAGPYRLLSHPMFYGIGWMLIGSWLLLPNMIAGVFGIWALWLLIRKATIERSIYIRLLDSD